MCHRHRGFRVAVWVLGVAIGPSWLAAPIFAASDNWAHVAGLPRDTRVIVNVADGGTVNGRIIVAAKDGVTVRSMGQDEVIARERVMQVATVRDRSSIPLIAVAVVAGSAAAAGILYGCTRSTGTCNGDIMLVFAVPAALGYATHRATRHESVKVIYQRRATGIGLGPGRDTGGRNTNDEPVGLTGRDTRDASTWGALLPALPASLRGRR